MGGDRDKYEDGGMFGRLNSNNNNNSNSNSNSLFNKRCFKCGSSGHISQYCTYDVDDSQQQKSAFMGGGRDRYRDGRDGENNNNAFGRSSNGSSGNNNNSLFSKRCFRCGSPEHLSRYCSHSSREDSTFMGGRDRYSRDNSGRFESYGVKKCYKCGSPEHLAGYCNQQQYTTSNNRLFNDDNNSNHNNSNNHNNNNGDNRNCFKC